IADDVPFAVDLVLSMKEPVRLRRAIVDSLPDDGSVLKDRLYLILHYDAGELDKAFAIVQQMDLAKLSYSETMPILRVAQDQTAAEFVRTHESKITSSEAKIGGQAQAYLKDGDGTNALRSVIEGVKILKHPSPEQFGSLMLIFTQLGHLMPEFTLESSESAA